MKLIKGEFTAGTGEKSDVSITVGPGSGNIEIFIKDIPNQRFIPNVTSLIHRVLDEYEISDVTVTVSDFGALDFVLEARLRTAIRAAKKEEI